MKKLLLIACIALLSTGSAYADRGYGHGGGHGGGWGWGGAWIVPALIGSAIVYEMTQPQTVYVQPAPVYAPNYPQGYAPGYPPAYVPAAAPAPVQHWYFCAGANAYYPYVSVCPGGWQVVPAIPPDVQPSAANQPPPPR